MAFNHPETGWPSNLAHLLVTTTTNERPKNEESKQNHLESTAKESKRQVTNKDEKVFGGSSSA